MLPSQGESRVLVMGGGSFAADFTRQLLDIDHPYRVLQLERAPSRVNHPRLRSIVNPQFGLDWITEQILTEQPQVVVVACSAASPYRVDHLSLAALPFGATAPLQTKYLLPIARLFDELGTDAPMLVNACYPDITNQIAALKATPVDLGIGNGQALADYLTRRNRSPTFVVGHHCHLYEPTSHDGELLAWDAQRRPITNVTAELRQFRKASKRDRNRFSASSSAYQLHRILTQAPRRMSITAPLGYGGTIPCVLSDGGIKSLLHEFVSNDVAESKFSAWSRLEGVQVDRSDGSVVFNGRAAKYFDRHLGLSRVPIPDWEAFSRAVEELANHGATGSLANSRMVKR